MTGETTGAADVERASLDEYDEQGRTPLFEGGPRTVRLALEAGDEVPPHRHPDRDVLFHVLEGEVALTLGDETLRLSPGEVVRFDGGRDISPRAETDCEALVVLAPSG